MLVIFVTFFLQAFQRKYFHRNVSAVTCEPKGCSFQFEELIQVAIGKPLATEYFAKQLDEPNHIETAEAELKFTAVPCVLFILIIAEIACVKHVDRVST